MKQSHAHLRPHPFTIFHFHLTLEYIWSKIRHFQHFCITSVICDAVLKSLGTVPHCCSAPVSFLFPSALHFFSERCLQLFLQTDSPHAVCSALKLAPAKPGQPGSKTQGQLGERPGWLSTTTDKHVTMNIRWNGGGSVCYMERERRNRAAQR